MRRIPSDAEWVDSRVKGLPPRWERRLRRAWLRRKDDDYVGANVALREATAELLKVRIPLDSSDADICEAADRLAHRCQDLFMRHPGWTQVRVAMEGICHGQGIKPPPPHIQDQPAVSRMTCPAWWRRQLRKHQGRTVEAAAIRLGYVNKNRDLYVSEERFKARMQQNRRNAATLEATTARNEHGQVFTVAELADKSPANKRIRRGELMSRIAGCEAYADAEGHIGVMVSLTCPSRFHSHRLVNDGKTVLPNPKYDAKETPRTAHALLVDTWARARSALHRKGIKPYGFRISEPQHDGTPHWHILLFCPPDQMGELQATLLHYALEDSGDEPGATEHRCDFVLIDKAKGCAAAYMAKYVSKNIDGEHVGNDLEGKPAIESAKRVEAWCSTWGIRQFQSVGCPPVSVWRELRRIPTLPSDAPAHLVLAHRAANKQIQRDGDDRETVAWDEYCRAQGGMGVGREARIKLAKRLPTSLSRYGDAMQPRPFGVETVGVPAHCAKEQPRAWLIESARHVWSIERPQVRRFDWRRQFAETAQPASPRTRVNNCTEADRNVCADNEAKIQSSAISRRCGYQLSDRWIVDMVSNRPIMDSSDGLVDCI
jgi:hypothetical protein